MASFGRESLEKVSSWTEAPTDTVCYHLFALWGEKLTNGSLNASFQLLLPALQAVEEKPVGVISAHTALLHPAGHLLCLSPQFDVLLGGTSDFSVSLGVIYEER